MENKKRTKKVITFEKSALRDICTILGIPYDKNIIAFTKKGAIKNLCDLIEAIEDENVG